MPDFKKKGKSKSAIDQINTLTQIIDTRKKTDKIYLVRSSISVNPIFLAIRSLYSSVSASARVNAFNMHVEWFDIKCGLRQGCILSPILFNLCITDLALYLKPLGIGIQVGNERICILMYADNIVLLAKNSDDLQLLLNSLNDWGGIHSVNINGSKRNIVHFRTNSQAKTTLVFKRGEIVLDIVDIYKYLGVILQVKFRFEQNS